MIKNLIFKLFNLSTQPSPSAKDWQNKFAFFNAETANMA
jgi:hypothetical protein